MKAILDAMRASQEVELPTLRRGFEALLQAETTDEDILQFLLLLSEQELSADLLVTAAKVMRRHMLAVDLKGIPAIDTCGTGGDKSGSFNLSTAAGLLLAAGGVPVAKHGNRAITSKSGSADLLDALGIPTQLNAEQVAEAVGQKGFGFMLAPNFHPATSRVQALRRRLDVVTVFNFLGPLLNPAGVQRQVVGVFAPHLRGIMAQAFRRLGCDRVWVLSSEDGLDEVSVGGKTQISVVTSKGISEASFEPEMAGLRRTEIKYLKGGDATRNAQLLRGIFEKTFWGPIRDGIMLNAAAGFLVAGRAGDWKEAATLAKDTIESGAALAKLEELSETPPPSGEGPA